MHIRTLIISLVLLLRFGTAGAVMPNDVAPDFERVPLQGGQPIALSDYKGQVVVVDFWASWCAPCRKSMPHLEKLRQELKPRGFEVLAINVDARVEDALRFLKHVKVSYPVLRDTGSLPELYGLQVMPTSYIIDRQGVVRFMHIGFDNKPQPEVRAVILQLLGEGNDQKTQY